MPRRKTVRMLLTLSAPADMRLPVIRKELRDETNAAKKRFQHELYVQKLSPLPRVKPRAGHGVGDYLESDVSWVAANMEACVAFLKMMTGEK